VRPRTSGKRRQPGSMSGSSTSSLAVRFAFFLGTTLEGGSNSSPRRSSRAFHPSRASLTSEQASGMPARGLQRGRQGPKVRGVSAVARPRFAAPLR
jgi:hypothetical protein